MILLLVHIKCVWHSSYYNRFRVFSISYSSRVFRGIVSFFSFSMLVWGITLPE